MILLGMSNMLTHELRTNYHEIMRFQFTRAAHEIRGAVVQNLVNSHPRLRFQLLVWFMQVFVRVR